MVLDRKKGGDKIKFVLPEFDVEQPVDIAIDEQMKMEALSLSRLWPWGKTKDIEYEKVKEEINKIISDVLGILSSSKASLEDFQIQTVTFSIGSDMKGNIGLLGFGGVSAGVQTGIEVTLVHK